MEKTSFHDHEIPATEYLLAIRFDETLSIGTKHYQIYFYLEKKFVEILFYLVHFTYNLNYVPGLCIFGGYKINI